METVQLPTSVDVFYRNVSTKRNSLTVLFSNIQIEVLKKINLNPVVNFHITL